MNLSKASSSSRTPTSFFLQLLNAARGHPQPKTQSQQRHHKSKEVSLITKTTSSSSKLLPCFPLHVDHIRINIPPQKVPSSTCPHELKLSSTPEQFHHHLCDSIVNAKRRVKIATLYIGAGNGCMSRRTAMSMSNSDNKSKSCSHSPKEGQLLHSLQQLSTTCNSNQSDVEIKIIMDGSRALRPIQILNHDNTPTNLNTTSAQEVYYSLFPSPIIVHNQNKKGVSLFNCHSSTFISSLPSPLNEVMGVFHLKIYIIDDELILSGANLSEEYFTDRLDRYISFTNGANGLVDFYSELIDILYDHSTVYKPISSDYDYHKFKLQNMDEISLTNSLNKLFDGSLYKSSNNTLPDEKVVESNHYIHHNDNNEEAIIYAIPTFQPSKIFLQNNQLAFMDDVQVTRNLLLTTRQYYPSSSLHMSSAYLNPTKCMMSIIETFGSFMNQNENNKLTNSNHDKNTISNDGALFLLSAAPSSHGFKPKKKNIGVNGNGKGWIPSVFLRLAEEISSKISPNGGKILLYERDGFTFHAKGLWLTSGCNNESENQDQNANMNDSQQNSVDKCKIAIISENDLLASVVGSSNFGSRSEVLDWESNCILVINPISNNEESIKVKKAIAGDWNSMLKHCVEYGSRDDLKAAISDWNTDWLMSKMASKIARKYF